jgi:3-oxoacyl-[acyl-carrier-protein] synthase-1
VIAAGARCAVGFSAEAAAAAVRARISRLRVHPSLVDVTGESAVCAADPKLAPGMPCLERMVSLAEHALVEVLGKLRAAGGRPPPMPLALALPEPRPGFSAGDVAALQGALESKTLAALSEIKVDRVAAGHAGVFWGLRWALERLAKGQDELCLVGGVDSYLDPGTFLWLDAQRLLAREGIRAGFAPGEGAAVVALATDQARRRLGLPSLGRLSSVALAHERRDLARDGESFGEALTDAVMGATADLGHPGDVVTDLYGDLNGERVRTEDWGFTLARAGARFRDGTATVSPVGECGDLGAATAAFGCVLALQAWRRRYAHGRRALVWAGSWTGLRGAAMLEHEEAA